MIDNIGIIKGPGTVLGQIKVGSETVKISRNGRNYYSLVNDRAIIASKSEKELIAKGLPVLSMVLKAMGKEAGIDQMRWSPTTSIKKDNQMISDAMRTVSDNLKSFGIMVVNTVQDEISDQKPREASARSILGSLSSYRDRLKDYAYTIGNVKETSDILLRTSLAKKMWGSKDVMDIITASKEASDVIAENYDAVEICLERSEKLIGVVKSAFEKRIATDQVKNTVSRVIEDFSFLKSFMSRMAVDLQPLYRIDRDFKSKIGYPATWFFNPTTFLAFTDEYESLIAHVVKTASVESEVIEPLLLWKITGAI